MFDIPEKAWLPIGAVIAAFITGLISFVNMLIAKDQKTTEFRQAWIDSLRTEVARFIASATAIPVAGRLIDYKQSKVESRIDAVADMTAYAIEALPEFINCHNKILLLLNPREHKQLIDLLGELKNIAKISSDHTQAEVEATCLEVLRETQKILKTEWERVKRGERTYRLTKLFIIVALSGLILAVGALGVWRAMNPGLAVAIQGGKEHPNPAVKGDAPTAARPLP